jgi:hypothetical protein
MTRHVLSVISTIGCLHTACNGRKMGVGKVATYFRNWCQRWHARLEVANEVLGR